MSATDDQRLAFGAWLELTPSPNGLPSWSETVFVAFVDDHEIPGVDPREIDGVISGPEEIDDFISHYEVEPELIQMRLHYGPEDRTAFETDVDYMNPFGAWVHISYPNQRDEKPTRSGKYYSRPDKVVFIAFWTTRPKVPGIRPKDIFMHVDNKFELERLKQKPPSDWRIEGYRLYYAPRPAVT
jgi:hypothetical protein